MSDSSLIIKRLKDTRALLMANLESVDVLIEMYHSGHHLISTENLISLVSMYEDHFSDLHLELRRMRSKEMSNV